jgi:hypothetical protein
MLWKLVGAAMLGIGVSLFAQLDQTPDARVPRVMALAFLFFGLLAYAAGIEESIITVLRDGDRTTAKVTEPGAAADPAPPRRFLPRSTVISAVRVR